jgi:hypothetical protein
MERKTEGGGRERGTGGGGRVDASSDESKESSLQLIEVVLPGIAFGNFGDMNQGWIVIC